MARTAVLKQRLRKIDELFDVDSILNRPEKDTKYIAKYYRYNRLLYHLVNSRKGFVHLGISYDGKFKEDDMLEQARIVEKYIKNSGAMNILELAPGKAANAVYLAKRFPRASFTGIDLPNGQLGNNKGLSNLSLIEGDYNHLGVFSDNAFDVVYVIEALNYAPDKSTVIAQVSRILKPGGLFVVFDCYTSKEVPKMSNLERSADSLVRKSMLVPYGKHTYNYFRKCLKSMNYNLADEKNMTQFIIPSISRLEKHAIWMYSRPRITKTLNMILPSIITANGIAAYLWAETYRTGLHQYWHTAATLKK